MGYKHFQIQLKDTVTGQAIADAGGVAMVVTAGASDKVTLYSDKQGTSASNPIALTRGKIEFFTADTVNTVDLYVQCPNGQFVVAKAIAPMGPNEIAVDQNQRDQCMVIPFDADDYTAATETDTGFDVNTTMVMKPVAFVNVTTLDSGETIDVGVDGGSSDDADGLINGVSLAAAQMVAGSLDSGSITLGALLQSVATGEDVPGVGHITTSAEDVTITLSTGTDTAVGFIYLPYFNAG